MNDLCNELIEELFHSEYERLLHFAEAMLENPMLAEDCVQLTFCEAYRQIDTLAAHPNPKGWLRVVLRNKVLDCQKTSARYSRHLAETAPLLFEEDHYQIEDDRMTTAQILEVFRKELSPQDYQLLMRLVVDEASGQQVAEEFGISINACYKRLERIRKRLEKVLPADEKK